MCVRFGEASHPGPVIGTFNPTGLMHKSDLLAELPQPSVWAVTESHLSAPGLGKFRQELDLSDVHMRYLPGAPAERLSSTRGSIGGKSTGVGILSSWPVRALHGDFPMEVWNTARIQAGAVFIVNTWVKIGVAYGYAVDSNNLSTIRASDELLSHLTERIVHQSRGPRLIAGDFNNVKQNLTQFAIWKQNGFVELQEYAYQKWGRQIQPTSKRQTVIDCIWISKEMIGMLESVHTDDSFFADHSLVYGKFRFPDNNQPMPVWRKPLQIDWNEVDVLHLRDHLPPTQAQSQDCIRPIFEALETAVDTQLKQAGKTGLLPAQKGRCTTTCPTLKRHAHTPLKRSRPSEVQVMFLGEHFVHAKWCRQLRRLQSYMHLSQSSKPPEDLQVQKQQLWISIRNAPGFPKGFPHAWSNRSTRLPGSPPTLPVRAPHASIAQVIYSSFLADFKSLEKALINARVSHAKQVRSASNLGPSFRDLRKPQALPVQTLACRTKADVQIVHDDGITVDYAPLALEPDQPVYGPLGMLTVVAHGEGQLTLAPDHDLQEGDCIYQQAFKGRVEDVFQAFHDLWDPMWNKHLDADPDKWMPFLEKALPCIPDPDKALHLPPIQVDEWIAAVQRRKKTSAIGPDGVSRLDLLHMPRPLVTQLVHTLNELEAGNLEWPSSVLCGLITSIEKHDKASSPGDYRPITVLSQIYRTYAAIRSRQLLFWLDELAPAHMCGNRPGISTKDVWLALAQQIEHSHTCGDHVSGLVTDVVKCFNTIPRGVVLAIGLKLKIPKPFLVCWHNAIQHIQRRFIVSGFCSPPLMSCTGYPEGDGLSVCAMAILNVCMHYVTQANLQSSQVHSYVDNWEVHCFDPQEVPQALANMTAFAHGLDMRLDLGKTYTWSTCAKTRTWLKKQQLAVQTDARDLGGHLNYTKRRTMKTIRARITAASDIWDLLAQSRSPVDRKLHMLAAVAWPRCLHGVSGVWIGPEHAKKLRAAAMASLGWKNKGASSLVQFGLGRVLKADPGYYTVIQTFLDFRRHAIPELAYEVLTQIAQTPGSRPSPGPCGAFFSRLHELGWTWDSNGKLSDHEGLSLDLRDSPIQLLKERLTLAWCQMIGGIAADRKGFDGLHRVDWSLAHSTSDLFDADSLGLLRGTMNGTFYTRDVQRHMGFAPDTSCPFCGELDSRQHRFWECVHFASSRMQIAPWILQQVPTLPDCYRLHGWPIQVESASDFARELAQMPNRLGEFCCEPPVGDVLHLFTDGSCAHPELKLVRLATWAVVCADLCTLDFVPVSSGCLHSGLHTVLRAEIAAAISAVTFALRVRKQFFVWVDNQCVYDRMTQWLLNMPVSVSHMCKDHDLWSELLFVVRKAVDAGLIQKVVKVRSHEDIAMYSDPIEKWAIRGNEAADALALQARLHLPNRLSQLWNRVKTQFHAARQMVREIHLHFVRVGQQTVLASKEVEKQDERAWDEAVAAPRHLDVREVTFSTLPPIDDLPHKHTMRQVISPLHDWLQQLLADQSHPPLWVTGAHLLVHYQTTTNDLGFRFNQRTNQWNMLQDSIHVDPFSFSDAPNWIFALLRCLCRAFDIEFRCQSRIPSGSLYRCWTRCILVHMTPGDFRWVESCMQGRGATGIKSVRTTFKDLQPFTTGDS